MRLYSENLSFFVKFWIKQKFRNKNVITCIVWTSCSKIVDVIINRRKRKTNIYLSIFYQYQLMIFTIDIYDYLKFGCHIKTFTLAAKKFNKMLIIFILVSFQFTNQAIYCCRYYKSNSYHRIRTSYL